MSRRIKLFTNLSTFTMIGALALGGCSEKPDQDSDEGAVSAISAEGSESEGGESEGGEGTRASGSESEGGESEGGESENAGGESEGGSNSGFDPATNDVEYLHRLGQVRGHLAVFIALHNSGAYEMSKTHAKHPESELYADLVPAFKKRSMAGFATELGALSRSLADGGDLENAYKQVGIAITNNEPRANVATHLMAIAKIARTAGDEFKIGVALDGEIVNAHEYQDAYGFLMAARETLSRLTPMNAAEQDALTLGRDQLTTALEEFGDLTVSKTTGKSSVLYGVAARIELASLGLE